MRSETSKETGKKKRPSVQVLEIRNVSRPRAKTEILKHIRRNPGAWTSDIANDLRLDLDLVLSILKELRTAGEVQTDDDR